MKIVQHGSSSNNCTAMSPSIFDRLLHLGLNSSMNFPSCLISTTVNLATRVGVHRSLSSSTRFHENVQIQVVWAIDTTRETAIHKTSTTVAMYETYVWMYADSIYTLYTPNSTQCPKHPSMLWNNLSSIIIQLQQHRQQQ